MDKDVVYMYTIEYYSPITRKEIGSFVVMWLDPESVIESERVTSQKEKNKYHILKRMYGI